MSPRRSRRLRSLVFWKVIKRNEVLAPEHLVQHAPHEMHILIPDLHEDAAGFGEQFAGDDEPVAQIGQVGVDAEFPCVAERPDLLRLAGQRPRPCRPSRRACAC